MYKLIVIISISMSNQQIYPEKLTFTKMNTNRHDCIVRGNRLAELNDQHYKITYTCRKVN